MVVDFKQIDIMDKPILVLKNQDFTPVTPLAYAYNIKGNFCYNEVSTLEFDLPEYVNGEAVPGYNDLLGTRIVDLVGWGQFILMDPKETRELLVGIKHCKAYSLEYELTYKKISLPDDVYKFWDGLNSSDTVLSIILEYLMPDMLPQNTDMYWKLGTVDTALIDKYRTFDVSDDNIYNFIKSTLQETYQCIFEFDTYHRRINVRAVSSGAIDEPVLISLDNLAKKIDIEEDTESIVTALDVNGAEGVDIMSVNPTGKNKIYNLDYYISNGMIDSNTASAWNNWVAAYAANQNDFFNLTVRMRIKNSEIALKEYEITEIENKIKTQDEIIASANSVLALYKVDERDPDPSTYDSSYRTAGAQKTQAWLRRNALKTELSTAKAAKTVLETELKSIKIASEAIVNSLAFENYLTTDQLAYLNLFMKEDSIEDGNFVATSVNSYINEDTGWDDTCTETITISAPTYSGDYTDNGASGVIQDAILYAATTNTEMYAINGGTITCNVLADTLFAPHNYWRSFNLEDQSFTRYVDVELPEPLAAGTYLVSASITSSDTDGSTSRMYFMNSGKSNVGSVYLARNKKAYGTVTLSAAAYYVRLYAYGTSANSTGDTSTWNNIVITKSNNMSAAIEKATLEINNTTHTYTLSAYVHAGSVADYDYVRGIVTMSGSETNLSLTGRSVEDVTNLVHYTGIVLTPSTVSCYVTTDVSAWEQFSVEWDLYEYGRDVLERIAWPSYSFNVDVTNFFSMNEFASFVAALTLGQRVYLDLGTTHYYDLANANNNGGNTTIKPILTGVNLSFDTLDNVSLEFGSTYNLSDSSFNLVDLVQQSISMGKKVDTSNHIYNMFNDVGGTTPVREFMSSALDAAKNMITSASGQAPDITGAGMFFRKQYDGSDNTGDTSNDNVYYNKQIGVVNNSIMFTNDNWDNVCMAIGNFYDKNLGAWNYGIIAPYLIGTVLAGENLVIESFSDETNSVRTFRVDSNGVLLHNSKLDVISGNTSVGRHVVIDPDIGFVIGKYPVLKKSNDSDYTDHDNQTNTQYKLNDVTYVNEEPSISSFSDLGDYVNFYADKDGNVYLKGDIYAKSLTLGSDALNASTAQEISSAVVENLSVGARNLCNKTSDALELTHTTTNGWCTPTNFYKLSDYGRSVLQNTGNVKFTVSFDWVAAGADTACDAYLGLKYTASSYSSVGGSFAIQANQTSSGHFSHTFIPTGAQREYGTGWLVSGVGSANQNLVITITNFKFEVGDFATDWQPSPEDFANGDVQAVYIRPDGTIGDVETSGATGFVVSSSGLLKAQNAIIYGTVYSSNGEIGGWSLSNGLLSRSVTSNGTTYTAGLAAPTTLSSSNYATTKALYAGNASNPAFYVTYDGKLHATGAEFSSDSTIGDRTVSSLLGDVDGKGASYYAVCNTSATTSQKECSCNNFKLASGTTISVKFTNGTTTYGTSDSRFSLNVSGTGSYPVLVCGEVVNTQNRLYCTPGAVLVFKFDGTSWILQSEPGTRKTECSSLASVEDKVLELDEFAYFKGTRLQVSMKYGNTYSSSFPPRLSIQTSSENSSTFGNEPIFYRNGWNDSDGDNGDNRLIVPYWSEGSSHNRTCWLSGHIVDYVFDGRYWIMEINKTNIDGGIIQTGTITCTNANTLSIDAQRGYVGGWELGDTYIKTKDIDINSGVDRSVGLSNANGGFSRTINSAARSNLMFAIGSKFGVDKSGVLYAQDAVISGSIAVGGSNSSTVSTEDIIKSVNMDNAYYGTLSTSNVAAQTKEVTCTNFSLTDGAVIIIYNTYGSTYTSDVLKLNVNNTGEKDIYVGSSKTSSTNCLFWWPGSTLTFVYKEDATNSLNSGWHIVGAAETIMPSWNCSTSASAASKSVKVASAIVYKGAVVRVTMTNENTASSGVYLSLTDGAQTNAITVSRTLANSSGTAPTTENGGNWIAGQSVSFVFDGNKWVVNTPGTVISGSHIKTGTIDANIVNVTNINATNINAGTLTCTSDSKVSLTATNGSIGGWTLDNHDLHTGTFGSTDGVYLTNQNSSSARSVAGQSKTNWRLAIGKDFGVDGSGNLYCNSGNFKGTIYANNLMANVTSGSSTSEYSMWDSDNNKIKENYLDLGSYTKTLELETTLSGKNFIKGTVNNDNTISLTVGSTTETILNSNGVTAAATTAATTYVTSQNFAEASMFAAIDDAYGNVTAASIVAAVNNSGSNVKINADKVDITGLVTFTDLSTEGMTTINGGNITAGVISADHIDTNISEVSDTLYLGSGSYGTLYVGGAASISSSWNSFYESDQLSFSAYIIDMYNGVFMLKLPEANQIMIGNSLLSDLL